MSGDALEVVVTDAAERLSATLLALANPGPRESLDVAAERLMEVASDLQQASSESDEPTHPGWAGSPALEAP